MWTCPDCRRTFGRRNAGHTCSPALSLEEWLSSSPPHERPVADALLELVADLPDMHVEPVQVGLFLKRGSTFAQLRTMTRWVALTVKLAREVTDPEPSRKVQQQGSRFWHTYNLRTPDDLARVADLVVEAHHLDA